MLDRVGVVSNTTTLDSGTLGPSLALSNGNLTVTSSGANTSTVRSVASHATGTYYCEITLGTAANALVGSCASTQLNNNYVGQTANGSGCQGAWQNGTGITTGPAMVAGHTYGYALDATNRTEWLLDITGGTGQWNSNATANPATNTNGHIVPAGMSSGAIFAAMTPAGASDSATYNFGATAYVGTPPSGFVNW